MSWNGQDWVAPGLDGSQPDVFGPTLSTYTHIAGGGSGFERAADLPAVFVDGNAIGGVAYTVHP